MTRHVIGIVILATVALTGCGREDSTVAEKAASAQRAAADAADQAAVDTKVAADTKIAADVKAAGDTKDAADAKIAADVKAASAAKVAADQAAVDAAAAIATGRDTAKATSLLAQLEQQIKDGELKLADATLTQLDGVKGPLPASLQEEIESARTALALKEDAAKPSM